MKKLQRFVVMIEGIEVARFDTLLNAQEYIEDFASKVKLTYIYGICIDGSVAA